MPTLMTQLKRDFATVKHVKPASSRKDSSERYVLAMGFRGQGKAHALNSRAVIARSAATKQSIMHTTRKGGLLRFARNDAGQTYPSR